MCGIGHSYMHSFTGSFSLIKIGGKKKDFKIKNKICLQLLLLVYIGFNGLVDKNIWQAVLSSIIQMILLLLFIGNNCDP